MSTSTDVIASAPRIRTQVRRRRRASCGAPERPIPHASVSHPSTTPPETSVCVGVGALPLIDAIAFTQSETAVTPAKAMVTVVT